MSIQAAKCGTNIVIIWTAVIILTIFAPSSYARKQVGPATRLMLRFIEASHCPDTTDNFIVHWITVRESYISGLFEAVETIHRLGDANVVIKRCRNECEHFQTWRFKGNNCKLLDNKELMWYPFYHSTTPVPIACPIQKGNYTMTNGTMNARLIEALPVNLMNWDTWKIRVEYWKYKAQAMEGCFQFAMKAIRKKGPPAQSIL